MYTLPTLAEERRRKEEKIVRKREMITRPAWVKMGMMTTIQAAE